MEKHTELGDAMRRDAGKLAQDRARRERYFLFGVVVFAFVLVVVVVIVLNNAGVM